MGAAFHLWSETRLGLTDGRGHPLGEDFVNFYSGARLFVTGGAARIYDVQAFHAFHSALVEAPVQLYTYSYPPTMPLVSGPLGWLPYLPALLVWSLAGLAAFGLAMRHVAPPRDALLYTLAAPAVFMNLMEGQTGLLTAGVTAAFLLNRRARPILAGALFGLMVCKPQLALVAPLALLAERNWKAFFAMAASAGLIILATLPTGGLELWTIYVHRAGEMEKAVLEGGEAWPYIPSAFMMVRTLGAPAGVAFALQGVVGLAAVGVTVVAWRGPAPAEVKNAVFAIATLLVSPYVQHYDLALLAFVPCWLLKAAPQGDPRRSGVLLASTLLLAAPLLAPTLARGTGVAAGWLLLLPGLWMALSLSRPREPAASAQTAAPGARRATA